MSVVPRVPRLTPLGLLAAGALLLGTTACTGLDEASAASLTRDDLISETAAQLAAGDALTYTATYHLAGGDTATITQAQKPARSAYVYPGGRLIVTPSATIRCKGSSCTESAPDPAAPATLTGALVTPEAAQAMLATAALDPEVVSEQRDTTIAGRHATCLSLDGVTGTPASAFDLCVTNEGALASFTATIAGKQTDVTLTALTDDTSADAFTVPAKAKLTSQR
ncbi:hypothetical protein Ade02nite_28200 [Paractinoplanes deccanensis]|uniref:Lipoprotein n=1 Tax=Paractinoplanes deccanensis TaxID=113561 RepID=A0ABQ3Y2F9_9ACTN|nr:hypothetical protein Ade02nite_28200 [Actinoplanes deccanensis]